MSNASLLSRPHDSVLRWLARPMRNLASTNSKSIPFSRIPQTLLSQAQELKQLHPLFSQTRIFTKSNTSTMEKWGTAIAGFRMNEARAGANLSFRRKRPSITSFGDEIASSNSPIGSPSSIASRWPWAPMIGGWLLHPRIGFLTWQLGRFLLISALTVFLI